MIISECEYLVFILVFCLAKCAKGFNPGTFAFYNICPYEKKDSFATSLWTVMNIWQWALLFTAAAIYGIGLCTTYKKLR